MVLYMLLRQPQVHVNIIKVRYIDLCCIVFCIISSVDLEAIGLC